ncbi:hypothetical protein AC244_05360 [Ensifer adhaerens]|uniref:Uncharacterized protein n=1 Tax=Ensifer adhaerens TaxID=106592 RepID=A0A0L8C1N7_ENSAD|nr:hypothetical protein AC244_05360 [Ensifer adhaerens]
MAPRVQPQRTALPSSNRPRQERRGLFNQVNAAVGHPKLFREQLRLLPSDNTGVSVRRMIFLCVAATRRAAMKRADQATPKSCSAAGRAD